MENITYEKKMALGKNILRLKMLNYLNTNWTTFGDEIVSTVGDPDNIEDCEVAGKVLVEMFRKL